MASWVQNGFSHVTGELRFAVAILNVRISLGIVSGLTDCHTIQHESQHLFQSVHSSLFRHAVKYRADSNLDGGMFLRTRS